jgi:hypothetical protein
MGRATMGISCMSRGIASEGGLGGRDAGIVPQCIVHVHCDRTNTVVEDFRVEVCFVVHSTTPKLAYLLVES